MLYGDKPYFMVVSPDMEAQARKLCAVTVDIVVDKSRSGYWQLMTKAEYDFLYPAFTPSKNVVDAARQGGLDYARH